MATQEQQAVLQDLSKLLQLVSQQPLQSIQPAVATAEESSPSTQDTDFDYEGEKI
jgi:hypothetical protein